MTPDFTFTEAFYPVSSLVDGVYFNENERYAVVNLEDEDHDRLYRYNGVDRGDVEELVNANSVGREYSTFKRVFGPAVDKWEWGDAYFRQVDKAQGVVQNIWDTTPAHNAEVVDLASHRGARAEATREVSLNTPAVAGDGLTDYAIRFTINGETKTHVARAPFLRQALDIFEDFIEVLDLDAEVESIGEVRG